jgi:hypothetical protein
MYPGRCDGQEAAHRCPYPDCDKAVPFNRLSCPTHWFELPPKLRKEIWDSYRSWSDTGDHERAIARAIAFWKAQAHWRERTP